MLRLISALTLIGLLVALIAITGNRAAPSVAQNGPAASPVASPTGEPTEEPTEEPTAPPDGTPVGSPTPEPTPEPPPTPPSNLVVTVYCKRNPELTRVDNMGEGAVTIVAVGSRFGVPVAVERPLGPGRTVIFRSDSGATYGTILTTDELYQDGNANEGAIVRVSTGRGFLSKCVDVASAPTPPSNLAVTVYCHRNPELTRIDNLGEGTVTIVSVTSRSGVSVETSRLLGPGRTVIFRSDSGATYGTILTNDELYDDQFAGEGAVVRVHTGRGFAASCVD